MEVARWLISGNGELIVRDREYLFGAGRDVESSEGYLKVSYESAHHTVANLLADENLTVQNHNGDLVFLRS